MFWGQRWQNLDSERVPLKGGLEQECEMEKTVCSVVQLECSAKYHKASSICGLGHLY